MSDQAPKVPIDYELRERVVLALVASPNLDGLRALKGNGGMMGLAEDIIAYILHGPAPHA